MTQETKHTPGEWSHHIGDDYFTIENDGGLVVVPPTPFYHGEGQEHDVYLLTAAPNLLAALEMAISKDMLSGETRDAAVSAIKKAKGEA